MSAVVEPKPDHEFDWSAVVWALFAAHGITSGLWRLGVKLRFAGVSLDWTPPDADPKLGVSMPTALTGMEGLALFKVSEPGSMTFDASAARTVAKKPAPKVKRTSAAKRAGK